ncbi:MAG TPA: hypothetical protein VFJ82_11465 [Longimicrobium sp.]|nr:hypothetical protein [Longimicrobium sp.]
MKLSDYLRLPWTVVRSDHDDDGEYIALHVAELPGFVVAARTADEVEVLFWDALGAFLSSYLESGEEPPVPELMLPDRPQLELLPDRAAPLAPARASFMKNHAAENLRTVSSSRPQFAIA